MRNDQPADEGDELRGFGLWWTIACVAALLAGAALIYADRLRPVTVVSAARGDVRCTIFTYPLLGWTFSHCETAK